MEQNTCSGGDGALNYWLKNAKDKAAAEQGAWLIGMDEARRFIGCDAVTWRFYVQPVLFADEVLSTAKKQGAAEFIVLHSKPGFAPVSVLTESKARARAIILAARLTPFSLLDYILRGERSEKFRLGIFSLCSLRSFSADDPFPPKAAKTKKGKT
ncbi:MAG: hypothetical protein ACRED1_02550 [Limisphaerales bacterium]